MTGRHKVIIDWIAQWNVHFVEPTVFGTTDPHQIAELITEYEAARGKPFTPEEIQTLEAAKIYGLAYAARCEHALQPDETSYPDWSCRSRLLSVKGGKREDA